MTYTIDTTHPNYSNVSITASSGPYTYSTGAGTGTYATWTMPSSKIKITDSDIDVDGVSLKDFMTKVQDRLAILVPDPKKLEEFAALKEAYEHYRTLEALCIPTEKTDK